MDRISQVITLAIGMILMSPGIASTTQDEYTRCLIEQLETASDTDSVGMLRETCGDSVDADVAETEQSPARRPGLIERRMILEKKTSQNRFAITQHKSSYLLPVAYNSSSDNTPIREPGQNTEPDKTEVKFQFSFKAQLFDSILNDRGRIYFGYTNQSHWQLYNQENSSPFRETVHEPELFLDLNQDYDFDGWHSPMVRLGFVHQSNGRSMPLSRSWNRVYAQTFLEKGKYAISFKPWIEIPNEGADEDNPDIDEYMGNFELGLYRQGNTSATSILLRNNLRSKNRGAIEFNWSKPLPFNKKLRFLFQYFYGYGETMVDYNVRTNRVGIGLQLSDLL